MNQLFRVMPSVPLDSFPMFPWTIFWYILVYFRNLLKERKSSISKPSLKDRMVSLQKQERTTQCQSSSTLYKNKTQTNSLRSTLIKCLMARSHLSSSLEEESFLANQSEYKNKGQITRATTSQEGPSQSSKKTMNITDFKICCMRIKFKLPR